MRKKTYSRLLAGAMAVMLTAGTVCTPQAVWAEKTVATETKTESIKRVTVHDPSIVKDRETGTYYVFGSHMATAKSDDLVNWTQISTDYQFPKAGQADPVYGNVVENFAESFRWAGYADGDCKDNKDTAELAVWAPDVFWDEAYEWADGSKGAYLMYYTASSTWKRSCIGVAVAKTIEGPYAHLDTLVYSGMTSKEGTDGNSERDTKWDNDYLNFKELIEKGANGGGIDAVSDDWFKADGSYNTAVAPNCIDPAIVTSADGKIYMSYGSWSGGLFMLEIDPKTGLAIYPGVDGTDAASGNRVDRYYGIHIAGGNPTGDNIASGEAPYITYDEKAGYYYLYETYGGLTRTGGYNMRLFRSKNVTGPYVDAAGNEAQNSSKDTYKYGVKLIGNYAFYNQRGYCAAGHNSALIDTDGAHYLVSHQRFDEGTEFHEVRIRQQIMNEDGWPVTAVYENRNEAIANYKDDQVVGTYEFINHGDGEKDGSMIENEIVILNADGTVSGDEKGTWKKTDSGSGYDYVTITLGSAVYKGVFFEQTTDLNEKAMTFTAIGNNNQSIWGSMLDASDEKVAEVIASRITVPAATREKITLPTELSGAKITWASSDESVVSTEGEVKSPQAEKTVTLTATIAYGTASTKKDFKVKVYAKPLMIYGYNFNKSSGTSVTGHSKLGEGKAATLEGSAKIVTDSVRGNVLQIENEAGAKGVNYLRLPEDTFKNVTDAGYTVSMWVNLSGDTFEHSALFEADAKAAYPMTRIGANLIGRINATDYSDALGNKLVPADEWHMVMYSVGTKGIRVYLDGELVTEDAKDISGCFNKANDVCIQNATDVMVGAGFIWNDEDVRGGKFDLVKVYNGVFTPEEARSAYQKSSK
ncbi:MAG: family 43 glycosylhydrolase [Eubacterium sp.]|nr:family 43 glycosylhydrolase [Eubacterium sp.]